MQGRSAGAHNGLNLVAIIFNSLDSNDCRKKSHSFETVRKQIVITNSLIVHGGPRPLFLNTNYTNSHEFFLDTASLLLNTGFLSNEEDYTNWRPSVSFLRITCLPKFSFEKSLPKAGFTIRVN
jgi:hypothetical protein